MLLTPLSEDAPLRNELGDSRRSIKTVMSWTGACERTVKNWLAGTCGPSGIHLVELAKHSDEIFDLFLVVSDRRPVLTTLTLAKLGCDLTWPRPSIDSISTYSTEPVSRSALVTEFRSFLFAEQSWVRHWCCSNLQLGLETERESRRYTRDGRRSFTYQKWYRFLCNSTANLDSFLSAPELIFWRNQLQNMHF